MPNPIKRTRAYNISWHSAWKTAKQQRYFFWALKLGRLTLPYRRTGQFKQNWVITARNHGLTQRISNTTPYGPLLMDSRRQSPYFKRTAGPRLKRFYPVNVREC